VTACGRPTSGEAGEGGWPDVGGGDGGQLAVGLQGNECSTAVVLALPCSFQQQQQEGSSTENSIGGNSCVELGVSINQVNAVVCCCMWFILLCTFAFPALTCAVLTLLCVCPCCCAAVCALQTQG
jgi:hypothetical protein